MPDCRLDQIRVHRPEVVQCLQQGDAARAERTARDYLSMAMSDLAVAQLQQGRTPEAIKVLEDALNNCPSNPLAFHNLVAAMMNHRLLHGNNLDTMVQFVSNHLHDFPWVREYAVLLVLPRFINLEFVSGKCNLKCRMCQGTNGTAYPNALNYIPAEVFAHLLLAVPTAGGLTLSSGDSDPLLHPEFERILDLAAAHNVTVDLFTNGHALSARVCRKMVQSRAVNMINFSIDAATPETYRRIRGASLEHVLKKIEMLNEMRTQAQASRPWVSMSFVAMADNIEELPDFVRMAARLHAQRVYVEYLMGWDGQEGENRVPSLNERYATSVREAQAVAVGAKLPLSLPERMLAEVARESSDGASGPVAETPQSAAAAPAPETGKRLQCCGWVRGVFVTREGNLDPCCMVHNVADMGNVRDGPLHTNEKHLHVKRLLASGRVFKECLKTRMCPYVEQMLAAGTPPEVITPDDLGPQCLPRRETEVSAPDPEPVSAEEPLVAAAR